MYSATVTFMVALAVLLVLLLIQIPFSSLTT